MHNGNDPQSENTPQDDMPVAPATPPAELPPLDYPGECLLMPADSDGPTRPAGSGSPLVIVETPEAFRERSIELLNNARRQAVILSDDLEPWLYDNDAFCTALLQLAQRSAFSEVRILVRNVGIIMQRGNHRLVETARRASSKIHMRRLNENNEDDGACYLITDDDGILYRKDSSYDRGSFYASSRQRVRAQLEAFNRLWQRGQHDADLSRID